MAPSRSSRWRMARVKPSASVAPDVSSCPTYPKIASCSGGRIAGARSFSESLPRLPGKTAPRLISRQGYAALLSLRFPEDGRLTYTWASLPGDGGASAGARILSLIRHVADRCKSDARCIEGHERAEGGSDGDGRLEGRAERSWNEVAAASADGRDEAEHGSAFGRPQSLVQSFRSAARDMAQLLVPEDDGDHPVRRAVAQARRREEHQEHGHESAEPVTLHRANDAERRPRHGHEVPEGDLAAADRVGQLATEALP